MTDALGQPALRLAHVPGSGIRAVFDRAAALEAAGIHVLHLDIGRPDFDTPRHIKEAATRALEAGLVHYSSNWGIPSLRAAIARKLERENGLSYSPDDEIIVTIGANEAVLVAMMAFLNAGDEVIVPSPSWPHYAQCARLAGAEPVFVQLQQRDEYRLDPVALANALTARTRMVVLCTPHNPTGAVLDVRRLGAIAEVLRGSDALVLADEIYDQLVYDGVRHVSPATIEGLYPRTMVVSGFAKAYAMDGWRLGYLAGPRDLLRWPLRVHQYTTVCAPTFEQHGAVAALDGPQTSRDNMVAEYARRRKLAIELLAGQDVLSWSGAEGAFYFWATYPDVALPADALALALLDEEYVAVVPGSAFDETGTHHHAIRIAYSCSQEDLQTGMRRLIGYVKRSVANAAGLDSSGSL